MNSTAIRFFSILLIAILFTSELASTQRSSNGRHRNWNSEEDLQAPSLALGESLVIHQNVPPKSHQNGDLNSSIVVRLDDRPSINLTPEPLAAEILKVDLSKSAMLIVSSSPSYLLTNQTAEQERTRTEKHRTNENSKNINFVHQTRRMLNPNLASKNCLSTLDCDLELNERCLLRENEEVVYYEELARLQPYTSIYSPYLRKKYRNLNGRRRTDPTEKSSQPICGCAPSFVRNQNSGICELLRVVELRFRVRTDRPPQLAERNFNLNAALDSASRRPAEQRPNLHQLKLDALGQIDYVMKNSDSLHDIVHHFRLTELALWKSKSEADDRSAEESAQDAVDKLMKRRRAPKREISSSPKLAKKRMQNQYIARGLLLIFSSEYTTNFDLLFTNEYCSTQNTLRMRAQEKMINQALAATNQTWPAIHFNSIRSADFWPPLNESESPANEEAENQSDRIVEHRHRRPVNSPRSANRNDQLKLVELPFIHHRKRREAKEPDERFGLDVQLIEVNSDQINICTLNANYAQDQLNEARRKLELDEIENLTNDNNSTSRSAELEKKQKQLEYERRFFRLIYCDESRAFCNSLPRSRAGYVCVCHSNLMDLSPLMELPGELCGVKCPPDYCGPEGFCHVKNSIGYYPNPDHDLAIQQKYLSTAGRVVNYANGGKSAEKKKKNRLESEEGPEIDPVNYQALIEAHKKNQTLLRQRYYAAIYSVQQRFEQLFENLPSSDKEKDKKDSEKQQFEYNFAFSQTPQLITFYCSCPGWTMGSRCQFSGWMILLVLGILVILLALITICTVSMLCAPGKSKRRTSTKSNKSGKSNAQTASLTISDSSSSSFDVECSPQQQRQSFADASAGSQKSHHNQFHNPESRQRRASEFVNDRRSSFANLRQNTDKSDNWTNKSTAQPIAQSVQPAFNIIHATPPHQPKEPQKIQFTDTVTEIPYDPSYGDIAQISARVPLQQTPSSVSYPRRGTKAALASQAIDGLPAGRAPQADESECRFEFYDLNESNNQHLYSSIEDDPNYDERLRIALKKPNAQKHVHNVYASAGEIREIDSDGEAELPSAECLQSERRSVGSQTSGFQSDPSLAYLSAISLRQSLGQLQYDQQKAHRQKSNQLPTTSISGPIVWF